VQVLVLQDTDHDVLLLIHPVVRPAAERAGRTAVVFLDSPVRIGT